MHVVVEADGGSRGNPGEAAYGALVLHSDTQQVLAQRAELIGHATNNVAEYRGLIAGLEAAVELGAEAVDVRMDSKLVVEQMSGRWKIKHPDMQKLALEAANVAKKISQVRYTWIPREKNTRADALLNAVLDGEKIPEDARRKSPEDPQQNSPSAVNEVTPTHIAKSTQQFIHRGDSRTPSLATRLLLVRHGQTPTSGEFRCVGRTDNALTRHGKEQAAALAKRLAVALQPSEEDTRGRKIISSPLQRTRQTADIIAESLGVQSIYDERLVEMDYGEWEGMTFAELRKRDPQRYERWLRDGVTAAPGGESFTQVQQRMDNFIREVTRDSSARDIIVVSHVSPIKVALRGALCAGWEILTRLHLDLASLSTVDYHPEGKISVRGVNDISHWADISVP